MRDRVDRLRQRIRESSKLFLWIHYLDPHHPYVARDPFAAGYRAESGGEPWPKLVGRPHSRLPDDADTEQERRKLVGLYDSEIAFVAAELAALLEDLSLDDEALIVLTSDHGEAFYEHGYWGHSAYLFEQELRVPLIIRFPSSLGLVGQVDTAVSILDVAPTILEVAGVAPLAPSVGRSLVPLARGASEPARPIFAELVRHGNRVYAVRRGPFKLIDDRRRGVQELFDLEHDPGEERNLLEHPTPEARAALPLLRALLREHREAATAASLAERQAIGAEEAEALRALGYVE
jgi:arylsulfatase A-like enzyme